MLFALQHFLNMLDGHSHKPQGLTVIFYPFFRDHSNVSGPNLLSTVSWPLVPRFDKSGQHVIVTPAPAPAVEQSVQQLTWDGEPTTVPDLLNIYNLECKCLGRWGGTTLFLVDAKNRNGKTENVTEGQAFKLFLETSLNLFIARESLWYVSYCKLVFSEDL